MAQRFTVGTNYLSASANIPDANSDYTTMAWVRIVSSPSGTQAVVWRHKNFTFGPSNHDDIIFADFGSGLIILATFSTSGTTATLVVSSLSDNTWYHIATVRDGTAVRVYKDGTLADDDTNDNSARTDPTDFDVCKSDDGGQANEVDVEGLKFFARVLTAEQIAVEMKRTMPIGPNATNAWPFAPVTNGRDHYGSCPLTLTGTLGSSADPQPGVQFRAASTDVMVWVPAVSGGTSIEVPTATLTLATFAPQVNLGVIPPIAELVTATFAPRLDLVVIPPTATLVTETFEPTVTATGNVVVTPPIAELVTTSLVPVIGSEIVVPNASLTTNTFAPRIDLGVVPGTASLTTTGFAPRLELVVMVPVLDLVTATFVPVVTVAPTGVEVIVPTANLAILGSAGPGEGFAPTPSSSEVLAVETCGEWVGGPIWLNHGDQFYITIDGPSITGVKVRVVLYQT